MCKRHWSGEICRVLLMLVPHITVTLSVTCCYIWNQDGVRVQLDKSCQVLSNLLQDQHFLIPMVHTLEEQKSFSINDKSVITLLPPRLAVCWLELCSLYFAFCRSSFALQVCVSFTANCRASQQLVILDGCDGGSAKGPDAAEQQQSAQTVATTHRVNCGEAADQLGVHMPLRVPQGQFLLLLYFRK